MKLITTINWVIIGSYGLGLLWVIVSSANSQQDAAGSGMLAGLLLLCGVLLVALVILNRLPHPWAKLTALVLGTGPLILYLLGQVIDPLLANQRQSDYANEQISRENGSYYFRDAVRQQLAALIATGNVIQLQAALQQPVPGLNEPGKEQITLLDFATAQATETPSPEALRCLELLLAKGALIEIPDPYHKPTHFLATRNKMLLAWFLEKGASANAKTPGGDPLLFDVLVSGDDDSSQTERVVLLLAYGADPNATPRHQASVIDTSALMYAANQELWTICQLLLDNGADPAYQTPSGLTVQHVLAYKEKSYRYSNQAPPNGLIALKERLNRMD